MFQKNDRFLFAARIVFIVLTVIGVLASMIYPIYWAIKMENITYVFFMIFLLAACLIFYVFWNLLLSFLVDVKLIRNNLYQEDNANLHEFMGTVKPKKQVPAAVEPKKKEPKDQSGSGVYDD